MPRPRLTSEEWEIAQEAISQARKGRIDDAKRRGGETTGARTRNAHSYANSQEHLEHIGRKVRGFKGIRERQAQADEELLAIESPVIPRGAVPDFEPIKGELREDKVCDLQTGRIGIISDAHWPFHDLKRDSDGNFYGAYMTAIETLKNSQCDVIVLNGDMLDVYNLSDHEKVEARRSWKWELDVAKAMLQHLRRFFGDKQRIVFREGNHEERYGRYIARKAKELEGTVHLEEFLGLRALNIEWVDKRAKMTAGKLWIDHGHEWFGGGGVTPARNYRMKAIENILVGHVHRTSTDVIRKPLDGSYIGGWSVGCLCDLNTHYAARNGWNHGFAIVDVDSTGDFTVHNKMIIGGEIR